MDKCKVHAWSTTHEFVVDWEVYYTKVKLIQSKRYCSFPCHANYKIVRLCIHFELLEQLQLLQYSKLQRAKTMVNESILNEQHLSAEPSVQAR